MRASFFQALMRFFLASTAV